MAVGASGISQQSNGAAPSGPTKGILGSVDSGKGAVFGVDEIEARKTGQEPEKKKQAPGKVLAPQNKPAAEVAPKVSDSNPVGGISELEKLLEGEFAPKNVSGEITDQEAGLADPNKAEQPGETEQTRGESRQQVLANRLKEAETRNSQVIESFKTQANQFNQYAQGLQAKMHAMEVQNARMQAFIEARMQNAAPSEESQDPIERLKGRIAPDILSEVQKWREEDKREIAQLRQEREQERAAEQRKHAVGTINYRADKAAREHFMKGFSEEDQKTLGHEAGTLTLAYSYGKNIPQDVAAQRLRQFVGRAALALVRSMSEENKRKMEAGQQIQPPTAPGRGSPAARGNAIPHSFDDMKKADPKAKDALDFMFRQVQPPI